METSSKTSIIVLKMNTLVSMAADSRMTRLSGNVGSNTSNKILGFDQQEGAEKLKIYGVYNFVFDNSGVFKVSLEPTSACLWNHSIQEIDEPVAYLISGTPSLERYHQDNIDSVHPDMNMDATIEFVKKGIHHACLRNWRIGGNIHVVVARAGSYRR